jgi:hypothetical protein
MRPRDFVELFSDDNDPTRLAEFNGVALDTLAQWHILAAWCKSCGRVSVLNRHLMIKEMGNQYLRHLEPKLKCGTCKKRGGKFLLGQQPR